MLLAPIIGAKVTTKAAVDVNISVAALVDLSQDSVDINATMSSMSPAVCRAQSDAGKLAAALPSRDCSAASRSFLAVWRARLKFRLTFEPKTYFGLEVT